VACTEEKRDVERVVVGKSQGKRTPRYRWEINKKIDLLGGQKDVDWIDLAHNMAKWLVLVKSSNEPSYFIACRDFVTSSRTVSFSWTPTHRELVLYLVLL
jgi:hypothetical protein